MSRRKHCLNFQWRDDDPAWRAERENDRIVFRKIRREQLRNRKAAKRRGDSAAARHLETTLDALVTEAVGDGESRR